MWIEISKKPYYLWHRKRQAKGNLFNREPCTRLGRIVLMNVHEFMAKKSERLQPVNRKKSLGPRYFPPAS